MYAIELIDYMENLDRPLKDLIYKIEVLINEKEEINEVDHSIVKENETLK